MKVLLVHDVASKYLRRPVQHASQLLIRGNTSKRGTFRFAKFLRKIPVLVKLFIYCIRVICSGDRLFRMEFLLGKVTQQAMNYAIRSGVTLTATFAIRQGAKLVQSSPKSNLRDELIRWQQKLEHKVRIVSPAVDMIELIAARGNTSLESAVTLTKDLRYEVQALGQRLTKANLIIEEQQARNPRTGAGESPAITAELKACIDAIKQLLQRIEDAVPLINLAISTSGARLSTQLPPTVSPSRMLQASTFLTAGDTQYATTPHRAVQIGPTFVLTVYMLFAGHDRPQNEEEIRQTTWKEVIHKARVKMRRVPLDAVVGTGTGSNALACNEIAVRGSHSGAEADSRIPANTRAEEFAYQLMIIEDLDDDRVHDFSDDEPRPGPFDDVPLAGIREIIPIHEISKIFYADTSKVLNISPESEVHHPVLLLKRDVNAVPPRRMVERDGTAAGMYDDSEQEERTRQQHRYTEHNRDDDIDDPWRLPPSLDPEWVAFEVYTETESSDTESEPDIGENPSSLTSHLTTSMSNMSVASPHSTTSTPTTGTLSVRPSGSKSSLTTLPPPPWTNSIQTSLSLLELLLRLTSLQQFQQASHLSITDELLNFFLEESASTGAGGDETHRQAVRAEARRRVGWDPYDESPLKRRGEEYQYQYDGSSPYGERQYERFSREGTPLRGSPGVGFNDPRHHRYKISDSIGGDNTWSPSPTQHRNHPVVASGGVQTSSDTTGVPSDVDSSEHSPSPAARSQNHNSGAPRTDFLRRQGQGGNQRQGSPLKHVQQGREGSPRDEGLGTSPASSKTEQ